MTPLTSYNTLNLANKGGQLIILLEKFKRQDTRNQSFEDSTLFTLKEEERATRDQLRNH